MKAECPTCGQLADVTDLGELDRHGTPECPHPDGVRRPPDRGHKWAPEFLGRDVHLAPGPDTWNPTTPEGAA